MGARSRRCIVLRGTRAETREAAIAQSRALPPGSVLWACPDAPEGVHVVSPRALDRWLGQSVDAVVLDLHGALDPDAIARAEGLIRGGGALVLRMAPLGDAPVPRADFAVHPFTVADVGVRFAHRFARMLPEGTAVPIGVVSHEMRATAEQDAVVRELAATFVDARPLLAVVLADRGRGKSAALGRAIAAARASHPGLHVAIAAAAPEAIAEVLRFSGPGERAHVSPVALARGEVSADVIVIDEAAQLPVALLKRIVTAHPRARIALATTCRGYEGTGRGFALRFLSWARAHRPTRELGLDAPIRWDADDRLERWLFEALLLDAEPAVSSAEPRGPARHVLLDRARLAEDERLLRQVFGLLVHAHYRTTPTDLARMLDAPNLDVHVLVEEDDVVAASLVAREGGLTEAMAHAMVRGERRVAGHALADTIVSHALHEEAAGFSMIRSVRLAVHPERRRRGLARQLVSAVHAHCAREREVDLFGTVFGATPELVTMRQALGYEVVRIGVARGARSGEPAVVMVRPQSPRAVALVRSLREALASELDALRALHEADDGAPFDPTLLAALARDLPAPSALDAAALRVLAERYAASAQPVDVVAGSLGRFVRAHATELAALDSVSRTLLIARLCDHAPWSEVAARAGLPSAAAAMRQMREAMRALLRLGR